MGGPRVDGDRVVDTEYSCGCKVGLVIGGGAFVDRCEQHAHGPVKPVEDVESRDVVQVCMTGRVFHWFAMAMQARGLTVSPFPTTEDDLPTYMVGVGEELLRREGN